VISKFEAIRCHHSGDQTNRETMVHHLTVPRHNTGHNTIDLSITRSTNPDRNTATALVRRAEVIRKFEAIDAIITAVKPIGKQ
jgi:hypothetical protein